MSNFVAPEIKKFVVWDYVVFAGLFLVCASIGVFFAIKERKKKTSKEFLVGGKQMSCGPIAFSLTSSFMSAVTVLGTPSEVYRYGASFVLFFLSYTFVIILTSEIFLPVFYRSDITSTYEYLELRFNKTVRLAATLIYILQTKTYPHFTNHMVFFGSTVTGFDLWGSVIATGVVCTFYCTTGGLKAVVWADAFQMVIMVLGFVTVLIRGTILNGGSTRIWEDAYEGSRLNIFDFDVDPLRRHTFWTIVIGGTFTWLGLYGVNQSTIQRCISCKSEKHAKIQFCPDSLIPSGPNLLICNQAAKSIFRSRVWIRCPHRSSTISSFLQKTLFQEFYLCVAVLAHISSLHPQAALSIHGMCGGPMLGLFTLGIIFPCVNWKGAIGGFLTGITLAFWVGIGSFIYPAQPIKTIPLELSTLNCTLANTASLPLLSLLFRPLLADTWYSLSYLYFSTIGCLGCIISGLLISFATGPTKGEDIRPVLIKPVCNFFCFWSERLKTLLWCGVRHNSQDVSSAQSQGAGHSLQLPGYNPEEKSYTNMSKESRL
uniref:Solute carrier family 5 member 12 n=1 Tax=Pavo cristatus TaxID=9049 RepID=A0A8C9F7U5_PAVCR